MEYQSFDRYEYKIITIPFASYKLEHDLNQLGQEGWELINITGNDLIFKRKLECIITD